MTLIDELGPAKLHGDEKQAIRDAADALLFTTNVESDDDARTALSRLEVVVDRLLDADRISPHTADQLLDAVEGCGPQTEPLALPTAA